MKRTNTITTTGAFLLTLLPGLVSASNESSGDTAFSNPLFNALLAVIIMLAIIILALAGALRNLISSDMFIEKLRKQKLQGKSKGLILIPATLYSGQAFSQETAGSVSDLIGGLDQVSFYTMCVIIALELMVIGILFRVFRSVLGEKVSVKKVEAVKKKRSVLDQINATVSIEEEETILLDHEYDGIRELDNDLPPWWKYGFYLTILIGVVYLVVYHVTDSLPLQKEEYKVSLAKAEREVAEYMKNSANNVDETTVKLLTETSDLKAGKDLFISACAACHGVSGEGGVGPNLTDEYWMHNGSLADIFKSIKYGWPDKGMKAWKDDFSPMQIAQMTSYIKTLSGTNPPNAKEKQGELYVDETEAPEPAPKDSLNTKLTSEVLK